MGPREALRAFPPEGGRTRWTGEARSTGALVWVVLVFCDCGGGDGRGFEALCRDKCSGRGWSAASHGARTVRLAESLR